MTKIITTNVVFPKNNMTPKEQVNKRFEESIMDGRIVWVNGNTNWDGIKSFIHSERKLLLEEVKGVVEGMNKPVPCDCLKGGLIGENKYTCDKCEGTEWVKTHICAFNDGKQDCECYENAFSDISTSLDKPIKE